MCFLFQNEEHPNGDQNSEIARVIEKEMKKLIEQEKKHVHIAQETQRRAMKAREIVNEKRSISRKLFTIPHHVIENFVLGKFCVDCPLQELEDLQKRHEQQREELLLEKNRLLQQQDLVQSKLQEHEREMEEKRRLFAAEKEKVFILKLQKMTRVVSCKMSLAFFWFLFLFVCFCFCFFCLFWVFLACFSKHSLLPVYLQENELVRLEKMELSELRHDHEAFFKFTAGLESEAKERLETVSIRLTKIHEQISTKERELYEIYRKDQVRFLS